MSGYRSILDPAFTRTVSLADSYRICERFVECYLKRGDTPVSDFLNSYAGLVKGGQTTDPAAVTDYLEAAASVLSPAPSAGPIKSGG